MDEIDLVKYIVDNLKIKLSSDRGNWDIRIVAELKLGDNVISRDWIDLEHVINGE
jgi:hypothetical protein